MASIYEKTNGCWLVQFKIGGSPRRGIGLGKVNQRTAETVQGHVERLIEAQVAGTVLPHETAVWVRKCGSAMRAKLAKLGLIQPEPTAAHNVELERLGPFLEHYLRMKCNLKPGTLLNLRQCQRELLVYFGADRRLDRIQDGDADEFRLHLVTRRDPVFAENTARRLCGRAKQFFRAAVRKGVIQASPFADMKSCAVRAVKERFYFVSREEAHKVLQACPDGQWRLLFALV